MSADNGIYILDTPAPDGGREYRVAHLQCIEDLYYDDEAGCQTTDEQVLLNNALQRWPAAPCFLDLGAAYEHADRLAKNYPTLEYGIKRIVLNVPFCSNAKPKPKLYFVSAMVSGYILAEEGKDAKLFLEEHLQSRLDDGWSISLMPGCALEVDDIASVEKVWRNSIPFCAYNENGDMVETDGELTVAQILKPKKNAKEKKARK